MNGGLQSARDHIIQDIAGHQERKHGHIHPIHTFALYSLRNTGMARFVSWLDLIIADIHALFNIILRLPHLQLNSSGAAFVFVSAP